MPLKAGSDCAFLLGVLSDGKPHSAHEIRRLSQAERGAGMTVNSRASDLRKKHGYHVKCWHDASAGKRDQAWLYQLQGTSAGALPAEPDRDPGSAGSSSTEAVSTRDLSPSASVAGPEGSGRLPEAERDLVEILLEEAGFQLYRGEFDHREEELDLVDDELADGDSQRVLFLLGEAA